MRRFQSKFSETFVLGLIFLKVKESQDLKRLNYLHKIIKEKSVSRSIHMKRQFSLSNFLYKLFEMTTVEN